MPIASFICPTYEGAGYIAETIDSIQRQTVKDWELIIVDDGNDPKADTTGLYLGWLLKEDKRVRVVRLKKNKGCAEARNVGVKAARSDLILVIDHDDICHMHRLRETLKHFRNNPDTDIFHGGWVECDVTGNPMSEAFKPMRLTKKKFEQGDILFCHSTAAMPKDVAMKHPYRLVEGRTDDHVALDDWLTAGLKFRTTSKTLCGVRRLPMGQMQAMRAAKGLPPSWRE
jgi:hypothetical protein